MLSSVARVGFALLLTAGFAAGLRLSTGKSLDSRTRVQVCEGVFFWSLALVICTTNRRK